MRNAVMLVRLAPIKWLKSVLISFSSFPLLFYTLSSPLLPFLLSFFLSHSSLSTVPPVILTHPPPYTELIGTPTTFNLTVQFQSRFLENTTVTWRRNNSLLPDELIQTSYTNEINAVTVVNFPTVSRSDAGLYQVTIKNLEVVSASLMTTAGVYLLRGVGESMFQWCHNKKWTWPNCPWASIKGSSKVPQCPLGSDLRQYTHNYVLWSEKFLQPTFWGGRNST